MKETLEKIVKLVRQAQKLASTIGIDNIVQPDIIREVIMAEIMNHKIVSTKRNEDACDPKNPKIKYEYLSCYEGGSGQFDRMFKSPPVLKAKSLKRITRNSKIYMAFFFKDQPLKAKVIYEIDPAVMKKEVMKKLESSKKVQEVHLSFSEKWAKAYGKVHYTDSKIVNK